MHRFYGQSTNGNESVKTPRTPSPKPGQLPMETNPLEPPRLRRSNAIKRVGEVLVNYRREREDDRAESPTPAGRTRPFSFTRTGRQGHINIANTGYTANKYIEEIDISPMKDEWMWEDVRHIPGILTSFIKPGMSADELGFHLAKVLYGRDKSVGGIVTTLVNENVTYDEIAVRTLKLLDLYDDDGQPLYEQIASSGSDRRPNRPLHSKMNHGQVQTPPISPYARNEELLFYKDPNTTGPEIICPQPRHAALEREAIQRFLAEDDSTSNEDEDDEHTNPFADFDFAFDAPDADTTNANAYADDAYDASSSSNSSPFDDIDVQNAQAIQCSKSGPARFYSQCYDGGGVASATAADDTGVGAEHANRKQHNASRIPEQLRPGVVAKQKSKRGRFLID
ncbi:uncharacterized protein ASPGLDRAFT_35874 [Aspergillus glaucus CBS 516.65]|uniref:Uncharacterized protein n=1 Tax=Aspergillus glaucus CBS 516.65 TaxID=1160497 RepID=A0A1L9VIY6_ASPGL|nr:hypothetical protein ASPGLDRAFT_35874 [Aspergillus glaucus CBS 516.65]OJJ83864.1 hypothetical protein ASPGLDRAFT_35874 [Aspergillus glaucus CBS 516.65]